MRSIRFRNIAAVTIAVMLATAAGYALWARPGEPEQVGLRSADPRAGALPLSFPAPQFELPDQDGGTVSAASLRGKVTIVDFIFTSCANTCPKVTAKRSELQKLITDPRVTFLSISVDPQRDDQATRKRYAADHHIDETRWRFLSPPDNDAAMQLAREMKLAGPAASHGHGESPILHSDRFVLIDPQGKVRGAYPITDSAAMQRLIRDATALGGAIAPPR